MTGHDPDSSHIKSLLDSVKMTTTLAAKIHTL